MISNQTPFQKHKPPVSGSGKVATFVHLVLALVAWVVFGLFWVRVFYRTPPDEGAIGVLIIGVLLIVSVSLTVAWIRHNLILSVRYRDRRMNIREVPEDWSHDKLGREVIGPEWEILRSAPDVEIALEGERKIYRVS